MRQLNADYNDHVTKLFYSRTTTIVPYAVKALSLHGLRSSFASTPNGTGRARAWIASSTTSWGKERGPPKPPLSALPERALRWFKKYALEFKLFAFGQTVRYRRDYLSGIFLTLQAFTINAVETVGSHCTGGILWRILKELDNYALSSSAQYR
jgi:hypothetical protein